MLDIEKLQSQITQISMVISQTLKAGLQLLGNPYRFHRARMRTRSSRLIESIRFCVVASVIMTLLYFVTVSAVTDIKQPTVFVVAGAALNFTHMLMIAMLFAAAGKLAAPKVLIRVHFENVFYAAALLPLVAFLSQPLAHEQLKALLANHSIFVFRYRPAIANALTNSSLAAWSNAMVGVAYLYFSYLIYVGLCITAGLTRWRALTAVVPGTIGMFFYQFLILLPATQQFVHATTR